MGPRGRVRGQRRLHAAALPDKLRHLHARVQGQGARVRGLGALGRVHQEPRLRQPQMPSELWRVQVEVQGHKLELLVVGRRR